MWWIIVIACVMLFFFYASYNIGSGVYVKTFCRKKTTDKVVALTFDDGRMPLTRPKYSIY